VLDVTKLLGKVGQAGNFATIVREGEGEAAHAGASWVRSQPPVNCGARRRSTANAPCKICVTYR
jgi:hypothetical protein